MRLDADHDEEAGALLYVSA
jgi:hypothetical protein